MALKVCLSANMADVFIYQADAGEGVVLQLGQVKRTPPGSRKTKGDNFCAQKLKLSTKRYGKKIDNTAFLSFEIFNVFSHSWCKYPAR